MKTFKISIIFLTVVIISCNKGSRYHQDQKNKGHKITSNIDSLVHSLNTIEEKEQFLIQLYEVDQDVRNPDRELDILKRNNYDKNSSEYQSYKDRMKYTDVVNFDKAKKYLEVYGYPKFKPSNHKSTGAFRLICMHQPTYEKQLELFPYLYQAYKEERIDPDKFSFLLNNMHRHKYDESHPHAKTNEENIEQLLEKLELN